MKLYIVRHAIAFDQDPARWPDDSLRPLTPDGERRFRRAARGLKQVVPDVEIVLSSPWVRAWRTAEILAERAGWPAPRPCEALTGDSSPLDVVKALTGLAAPDSVALAGHEPQLHMLVSVLLTGDPDALHVTLKKGAVVALDVEGAVRPGAATLEWMLPPKLLRALAGASRAATGASGL